MSSRKSARRCLSSLTIALVIYAANWTFAIEPSARPEPLRYRRVFVPADELSSQAKGMIPIKREEFERRVADWNATQPSALASHVRVEQAVYSARLQGNQFIDGSARLKVVYVSSDPALLPLGTTLALGKPHWDGQPLRPARLGTTPDGASVLLVEESGLFVVPWTVRGSAVEAEDATFDLFLPKAAVSRLVLQLPNNLTIESDVGIVSRLKSDAADSQLFPASATPIGNWLIELGGLTELRLRVRSASRIARNDGVVLVRESATHVLSPVDVSSEFSLQLDVHQTELASLKVEVDATTRIVGVRMGGAALPWREEPAGNQRQTKLQIELPEKLAGSGTIVTVSTIGSLVADQPWRLPRLRLPGSTWQEGIATLVTSPSLQVSNVQLADARQTSISPGSPTQPEQTCQFQYLSPLGQITVQAVREIPRLKVLGGLVVRHEASQLAATLSLDLSVDSGERFSVEGITSEDWIVDSVDTTPQDLLEERQIVPLEGRKFALRLRLARPLTSRQKTRLVIRAHRQLPAEGEVISATALRLLELQDVREEQYVVALRATDGSRDFQLSGDLDSFRMDPESAAPEELSLLDSSAAGILFKLDRQAEGFRVSLVPSDPRFTAAIESSAFAQQGRIEQRSIARIVPTSASITRLIVRSSGPIPASMRWRLVGAGDLGIVSQTLLPAQTPSELVGQRESVWELVLSRSTNQPLTLEAAWETPFSIRETLPLFSFPEAASQDGLVRVDTGPGVPVRLDTTGVKPVPALLAPAGRYSTVRGFFRYEPGRQARIQLLAASKDDNLPAAWANSCSLLSRYSLDGSATHEFTWRLENHGLDRFPFSLPEGVRPLQVSVNGEDVPVPPFDAMTRQHYVPLPEGRRSLVVTLAVATAASARKPVLEHHWTAPPITTPLRTLDRSWLVILPPGLRPVSDAANAEDTTSKSWHGLWKSRLTGDTAHTFTSSRAEQFEIPWSESEPLVIAVYSPGLVRIGSIALAIAAASLVAWFASRRLTLVLLLAALFAVVALLVPAAWSPLAAGVFWGCLSGILLNLVKPIATSRAAAPRLLSSTRTLMATNAAGAFLILSMVAGRLTVVYSAPVESSDEPPAIKSHRVIIPVDANQKPQGEYVYVSLDFYTLLYRAPEREQLPAWLLRSATYEMDAPEGGVAANLVIRLEIETLAAQAKVSLPFQRGEVHLLEGRSTLDGEAIPLDWNETGTRLRLGVERPGLYQLTLAFSVAAEQKDGTASWRVNIPKTPRTSLRIKSAIRPEDWIFPTPRGAKTKSSDATDLLVDLGATEVIQVSRIDRRRPVNDMTVAEQFVWWNVRPGSVTADVHIRVRAMTGRIGEIKVRTDPHLRLLPLENEPGISRVWVDEGDANTIHLTLAEPASDTVQFKGKFLLLDASGVGRLTLPLLEVVADKKIKQWQAISVGRESEISQDPQTPMVSVPPVDFVDNIGGAARPPTLAWEAAGQSPAFFIRPRDGLVRAKEIMEVSLGRHDAEVHYRADLSGIPPERFQETIDLPAGFRVKQAALLERDAILSFRSPAAQQSPLTIRRARSPGQKQELVIEGTMPLNAFLGQANTIRLPSLRSAASDGAIVRIYRTPASLAVIKSAVGIEKSSTPEGAPWDARLGHLVASYKSAPTSQVTLREFVAEVRPNDPAASFRLVTKMERTTARSWSAVVNCEVTLESGSLDTVRLEVPAEWSGPFEFIPPMDHQIVLLPGQTQRHLIIRPHQTQTTSLTFSIRGPLKLQTGETPHAPVPLPLDAVRTDSYLMLPSRIADENLQWKTSGLQALGAGESRDNQLVLKDFEVFRIVAPRLEANLLQLKDTRAGASIALADYVLRPGKDGNYWSKAIYYLIPGGIDEAELRLPAGSNLVQILINDSPAEIRAESGGAWKIRLRHDQLPQYIVVIYEHHQEVVASDVFQAIPPVWKGMSVNKTIWTLLPYRSPNRSQYSRNDFLLEAIGPRHAELTRLSAVISLLHDAGDTSVSGLSPKQLGAWLSLWRSEFTSANKAALLAAPRTSGNALPMPDDQIESHRHSLEAEFSAALSRYVDIPNDSASTALTGREDGPPSGQEQLTVFSGNSSAPLSVKVPGSPTNLLYRLGLAISLLLVSFAAAFLASSTHLSDFFATAPVYLLAMVILVFLILIPVSQITAIIPASAAIWFSFRRSWPTSSAVAPPSRTLHLSALRPIRP